MKQFVLPLTLGFIFLGFFSCKKASSSDGIIPSGSGINASGTGGITGVISPGTSCTVLVVEMQSGDTTSKGASDGTGTFTINNLKPDVYKLVVSPTNSADLQKYGTHNWLNVGVSAGTNTSVNIPIN